MDDVTGPDLRADAAHILASLPNPVFVLDADDRVLCLKQAAEMCFDSSAPS